MPNYKPTYVVQTINHHKGLVLIMLFEDELDALREAGKLIDSQMMSLGMHHHNASTMCMLRS